MSLPALNIPVVGSLDSLKGFDDVKKEVSVEASGTGGGGRGGGGLMAMLGIEAGSDFITGSKAGILGGISSKLGSIAKGVGAVVASLGMLKSFRKVFGMILSFLEGVLWPVAQGYLMLMGMIMKSWPYFADFFRNPVDNLKDLAVTFGRWVWDGLRWVGGKIGDLTSDFVSGVGDLFSPVTKFLDKIFGKIKDIWSGISDALGLDRKDEDVGVTPGGDMRMGQGQILTDEGVETVGATKMEYAPTFNMTAPTRDNMNDILYLEERNRSRSMRDYQRYARGGN